MLSIPPLPAALRQCLMDCYPQAEAWLACWSETLPTLCQRWELEALQWVDDLSYHPVLRVQVKANAQRPGRPAILKLLPPGPAAQAEIAALNSYRGQDACQVIAADRHWAALLLEALRPGTPLKNELIEGSLQQDLHATQQAATLMKRLWQCPPQAKDQQALIPLQTWVQSLKQIQHTDHPFPPQVIQHAQDLFLAQVSQRAPVVLHGDLHHGNILAHTTAHNGFAAIDPKGLWGNPAYDVGSFLCNPTDVLQQAKSQGTLKILMHKRLECLSLNLKIPVQELAQWASIYTVLSACWTFEDHGGHDTFALELAQLFLDCAQKPG